MSLARVQRRLARKGFAPTELVVSDRLNSSPQQKNKASHLQLLSQHGSGLADWYISVVQASGLPPHSRDVAVAHEVGHAVVGMSLGGLFKSAPVFQSPPSVWCGWTECDWPQIGAPREVKVLDDPAMATHSLTFMIAGYCGEWAASLDHPASSPDEVYTVLGALSTVAHFKRHDVDELLGRLLKETRQRITDNGELFSSMCRAMTSADELCASKVAELVKKHGLIQAKVEQLW